MAERTRSIGSVRAELVAKSREAALSAIRTFNDPQVSFKSETFIVLMVIAWTYLLHAYYRSNDVEYRYFKRGNERRRFDRTKHGAFKYWDLERCLNDKASPVDKDTANNLRFLIGLRHEIEHQMTKKLDPWLSGRYQACAVNYNDYLKKLFGNKLGLDDMLSFSIQFVALDPSHLGTKKMRSLPAKIHAYVEAFDAGLSHVEYNSPKFSYRLLFKRKLANRPGQADSVIEFIDPTSDVAKEIDKEYWVKKDVEKKKYRAKDVVEMANEAGFPKLSPYGSHVEIWKAEDAKNPAKGYGVEVQGTWYWYQSWVDRVIEICEAAGDTYR